MSNEENYTSLQPEAFLLPTEAEERDIRSALMRRMAPAPDVDAAWEKVWGLNGLNGSSGSNSSNGSSSSSGSKVTSFADSRTTQSETARLQSMTSGSSGSAVLRKIAVLVAAAAACVLLFFMLKPESTVKDTTSGITILAQTAAGTEVTMTTMRGEGKEESGESEQHVVSEQEISFENSDADQSAMPSVILMTTPRGKDCHLTLADGTRVWMNADSQLEFPEQFNGTRRTVRLHGEAYFEVAKDRRHPFVVETDYLTTTVLGTSFNVRAYSQNDASVALVENMKTTMKTRLIISRIMLMIPFDRISDTEFT